MRSYFWPFTEVKNGNQRGYGEMQKPSLGEYCHTDSDESGKRVRAVCVLSMQSAVNFILAQDSVLQFLAEFLESGIGAQRVPHRIEP